MPDDNITQDDDKKNSEDTTNGSGQADNDNQGGGTNDGGSNDDDKGGKAKDDDMVQIPKAELDQIKSDRDNYRQATLDKKSKERSLKTGSKDEDQDGDGGESGNENEEKEDVGKVVDERLNEFQQNTQKNLQSRAQRKFLGKNQDFADDHKWNQLAAHIRLRGDEITEEDYADRIDEAHLLYLRETGQLDKHLENERQKAERKGQIDERVNTGRQAGDNGDGRGGGQSTDTLTPEGEQLTRKFGHEPDKVKKVNIEKDKTIGADKV